MAQASQYCQMAFVCKPEPYQQLSKPKQKEDWQWLVQLRGHLGDILGSSRTTFKIVFMAQASLASYCSLFCVSLLHLVSVHERETSHYRADPSAPFCSVKCRFYKLVRVEKSWLLNIQLVNCGFTWIALLRLFLHLQNWNPACVHPATALLAPGAGGLLAWCEPGGWGGSSLLPWGRGRCQSREAPVRSRERWIKGMNLMIRESNQIIAPLLVLPCPPPSSPPLHGETIFIIFGNRELWSLASLRLGLDELGQSIFIFKRTSTFTGAEGAFLWAYLVSSHQHVAALYVVFWMLVWLA